MSLFLIPDVSVSHAEKALCPLSYFPTFLLSHYT